MYRSTVQLSQDAKETKKIADVTSGIEAMVNTIQDVSVPQRGATLSSPPSTGKTLRIAINYCVSIYHVVTGGDNNGVANSEVTL